MAPRRPRRKTGPAFRHPKRECVWCGRRFRPPETLSPTTTRLYCSEACAGEAIIARLAGTYAEGRAAAHVRYQAIRTERIERMAYVRAQRWKKCEVQT